MQIINHRLSGVPYDAAHTIGGVIDPKFLVMHYTAGYTLASARAVFNSTVIAAHLTIDKDGSMLQMVPFNRKANHAGPSKWMGIEMLNGHSIGIEFVNIGYGKMRADGRIVDSANRLVDPEYAKSWIEAPNPRVGSGRLFWEPYTDKQIEAGIEATKAILAAYNLRDIVSHEEIDTRGWKTDPGPAFPMNRFTSLMRGAPSATEDTSPANGMVGVVNTASLNIRGGAGTQYPVIGVTKSGTRVGIIAHDDGWYQIHTNLEGVAGTGWISAAYVKVQ